MAEVAGMELSCKCSGSVNKALECVIIIDHWTRKILTHCQYASELIELSDIPDDTAAPETEGVVACPQPDVVQAPFPEHRPHLHLHRAPILISSHPENERELTKSVGVVKIKKLPSIS